MFQLPYAIVGVSVITAMLPRMSAHAAEGSNELVTRDFSAATRLSSALVVPGALILAVLGPPLAQVLFGHGSTSAASARYLGVVFGVLSLGLLPYTLFNLQLRVFYAMRDSRTPAVIGGISMAVRIVCSFTALAILPPGYVVAGVAAGFGISNLVMVAGLWRALGRRVGSLDNRRINRTLLRMHLAAVPGMVFAIAGVGADRRRGGARDAGRGGHGRHRWWRRPAALLAGWPDAEDRRTSRGDRHGPRPPGPASQRVTLGSRSAATVSVGRTSGMSGLT